MPLFLPGEEGDFYMYIKMTVLAVVPIGVKNMRLVPDLSQKVHIANFQLAVHVHVYLLGYSFNRAKKI